MRRRPKFNEGDRVRYTAGKRGHHYGFDTGRIFIIESIFEASPVPNPQWRRGEWGGWLVQLHTSNMAFPAGWFTKVVDVVPDVA